MKEFMQGFLGNNIVHSPPQYLQSRMNEIYKPVDTIQQYIDHFNSFRRVVRGPGDRPDAPAT